MKSICEQAKMVEPSERTRLLCHTTEPLSPYNPNIWKERQKRVKQFQCCLCTLCVSILVGILVVIVAYSINIENSTSDNSTNITEVSPSLFVLLHRKWPLLDKEIGNVTYTYDTWLEAKQAGINALKEKDEIEHDVPDLNKTSPSYKHQKVTFTTDKGRNTSRMGYVEEYATRFLHKDKNDTSLVKKICLNNTTSIKIKCNIFHKFRSYNGTCNNLKYPEIYGVAYSPFRRQLPPEYEDGISLPRGGLYGGYLPSARTVSLLVHLAGNLKEPRFTVMLAIWGQFLDHDISATAISQKAQGAPISCCHTLTGITSPECFPVLLDDGDPLREYNISCMEFVRSAPAVSWGNCVGGPREQMNQATAFIDASVVYGVDEETVKELRDMKRGRMRVLVAEDGRELLPPSLDPNGCNRLEEKKKGRYCFQTGDPRANENLHLTSMHLIWVRQHNQIATNLTRLNPHWNDERTFQEARRIVAAQIQHITYNEFLPILLGSKMMEKLDLFPLKQGYWHKYNDTISPNIANNFAASTFRFAHSIIPALMKFLADKDVTPEYEQMHKMLFNPFRLYESGKLDDTLRGAMNTSISASDPYFTDELKSHLFEDGDNSTQQATDNQLKHPKLCGLDLVALNIQRGRDHGLPGYVHWRRFCGFDRPKMFDDLEGFLESRSLQNIKTIYRHVEDVDLYTGALSEKSVQGSILGPTLLCLIADMFLRLKRGDRFWYENGDEHPEAFSLEQLDEIRKTSLAQVICDNSDGLQVVQPRVMERIGNRNGYMNCSQIQRPNMEVWREKLARVPNARDLTNVRVMNQIVG